MATLKEKIEVVRKYAPTQPDIILCDRILSVCDAATKSLTAVAMLQGMIDGGEECRGGDSEISDVIRVLESDQ